MGSPRDSDDFRLWPIATEIHVSWHVGNQDKSGLVVLNVSFVARDAKRTRKLFHDFLGGLRIICPVTGCPAARRAHSVQRKGVLQAVAASTNVPQSLCSS